MPAIATSMIAVDRTSVASSQPPAPGRADAGAEQQREQRHRQRIDGVAEQQHEPLQDRHLDQHEARAERAEIQQPREPPRARRRRRRSASGPRTNSTTSDAEMPISVSSALKPLPNSIDAAERDLKLIRRASSCGRRTADRRSSAGCPVCSRRRTSAGRRRGSAAGSRRSPCRRPSRSAAARGASPAQAAARRSR